MFRPIFSHRAAMLSATAILLLSACGGSDDAGPALPQLAAAAPATLS